MRHSDLHSGFAAQRTIRGLLCCSASPFTEGAAVKAFQASFHDLLMRDKRSRRRPDLGRRFRRRAGRYWLRRMCMTLRSPTTAEVPAHRRRQPHQCLNDSHHQTDVSYCDAFLCFRRHVLYCLASSCVAMHDPPSRRAGRRLSLALGDLLSRRAESGATTTGRFGNPLRRDRSRRTLLRTPGAQAIVGQWRGSCRRRTAADVRKRL